MSFYCNNCAFSIELHNWFFDKLHCGLDNSTRRMTFDIITFSLDISLDINKHQIIMYESFKGLHIIVHHCLLKLLLSMHNFLKGVVHFSLLLFELTTLACLYPQG